MSDLLAIKRLLILRFWEKRKLIDEQRGQRAEEIIRNAYRTVLFLISPTWIQNPTQLMMKV
ncbi:hypothetical protein T12_8421 [Trichinella patagoniensis]|uniref:Uncharacterized protein n=1 Tax=Trichinella patagoniensis TaxID=990121 RepID=A0A0V0ZNP6_9BILA|nr:hypothetical protein T12_8421 [Trichinella patagoniensis]